MYRETKRLVLFTRLPESTIKAINEFKEKTGIPKERMIDQAIKNYLAGESQKAPGDR